jgi:P-type conjugative transfer ATPase TrbB
MESSISKERLLCMLSSALGEKAGEFLLDPEVLEIMLNPDGKLWIDKLGSGRAFSGHYIKAEDAERVIYIVSSSIKTTCSRDCPTLAAELPGIGARFQGILPPLSKAPIFTIRKRAIKIFSLSDYVEQGVMSDDQKKRLENAVVDKKNILIVGGTGSGKTTLANAILSEISKTKDRVVIIEDTHELQSDAKDSVTLRTKEGVADMTLLLKATMRLRPDRIVIGEVRGPEALALLKAWNTGHPGGCATVHADSAKKGLSRLEQLVREAGVQDSRTLIGEAVNEIIYIERTATGRTVKEIVSVGLREDGGIMLR